MKALFSVFLSCLVQGCFEIEVTTPSPPIHSLWRIWKAICQLSNWVLSRKKRQRKSILHWQKDSALSYFSELDPNPKAECCAECVCNISSSNYTVASGMRVYRILISPLLYMWLVTICDFIVKMKTRLLHVQLVIITFFLQVFCLSPGETRTPVQWDHLISLLSWLKHTNLHKPGPRRQVLIPFLHLPCSSFLWLTFSY